MLHGYGMMDSNMLAGANTGMSMDMGIAPQSTMDTSMSGIIYYNDRCKLYDKKNLTRSGIIIALRTFFNHKYLIEFNGNYSDEKLIDDAREISGINTGMTFNVTVVNKNDITFKFVDLNNREVRSRSNNIIMDIGEDLSNDDEFKDYINMAIVAKTDNAKIAGMTLADNYVKDNFVVDGNTYSRVSKDTYTAYNPYGFGSMIMSQQGMCGMPMGGAYIPTGIYGGR